MRFSGLFMQVIPLSAFAGSPAYYTPDLPLPSPECTSLVLADINRTEGDDSAKAEVNARLTMIGPKKRDPVSQMKNPSCKKVSRYTAAFLTCSDILTQLGRNALRKSAAEEMGAHPDDILDVRICMHTVNGLNYSAQMTENIKNLFADTEHIKPPGGGKTAAQDLPIVPTAATAKER